MLDFIPRGAECLTSGSPKGVSKTLLLGHASSDSCRNKGPLHHESQIARSVACIPLLSMSAGFTPVGTYRHWLGSVFVCISPIRFATNGLKSRLQPRTHHSTLTLSHQNVVSVSFIPRTSAILEASRAPTIAPISSSLGILVAMFGDTHVLAATMLVETVLSSYVHLA